MEQKLQANTPLPEVLPRSGAGGEAQGDRQLLEEAVRNMATDFAAVISKSTEIEVQYPKITSAVAKYQNFSGFAGAEMSRRILGQTTPTEQGRVGT